MSHDYTTTYSAIATNASLSALSTALSAVPRDTDTEQLLGLTLVSDTTTTTAPNIVQRTIVLSDASMPADAPIPSGTPMAEVLTGYYTATFGQALTTPIIASPVNVT